MALAVMDIANKLLHRAWLDESSELLTNMKLQKLLYYQQLEITTHSSAIETKTLSM